MSDERLSDASLARIAADYETWRRLIDRHAQRGWSLEVAESALIESVPALLAEVERLRAENAEMYKSLMDYSGLEDDK